jgi:hypothetical protein
LHPRGHGDLWGKDKDLTTLRRLRINSGHGDTEEHLGFVDRICAGVLFLLALVDCLLVPRMYTGRIWIFGTLLALLFTAMLNVLRIRNGGAVRGLRLSCITANVTMFVFAISLMASIGKSRTLQNPQVPLLGALLLAETVFSLGKTV